MEEKETKKRTSDIFDTSELDKIFERSNKPNEEYKRNAPITPDWSFQRPSKQSKDEKIAELENKIRKYETDINGYIDRLYPEEFWESLASKKKEMPIDGAKKNSIGKKKIRRKRIKKKFDKHIVILITSLIFFTSTIGAVGVKVGQDIHLHNEITAAETIENNEISGKLNALGITPDNFMNSLDKIEEFIGIQEDDLFSYYLFMNKDYKILDTLVQYLGHENFSSYCLFRGYTESGRPSLRVWENYKQAGIRTERLDEIHGKGAK